MVSSPGDPLLCGYSTDHVSCMIHHMILPDTVVVYHNSLQSSQQGESLQLTNVIIR